MSHSIGTSNLEFSPSSNPRSAPFADTASPYAKTTDSDGREAARFYPPTAFRRICNHREILQKLDFSNEETVRTYLGLELNVSRLTDILKHLWMAGLPRIARPLHQQIAKGRTIVIAEQADCHLTLTEHMILLKPLPRFLMHHEIWEEHLCQDAGLFKDANGFLMSYTWLICYESDFRIAQEHGLIPHDLCWHAWTTWVESILERTSYDQYKDVNPRYIYGELRISRLNLIYRFCQKTRSENFIRGYNHEYTTYASFVRKNTTWFLVAAVYITIVLTAMQVGLGTEQLQQDSAFNRASYGFTVFSIVAPIALVAVLAPILIVMALDNLNFTLDQNEKIAKEFLEVAKATSLPEHQH